MILAPSVLSLDYTKFNEQVSILNENVSWLHFDVMDGHFVPNLSFGPDILKAFKKASPLFMDVHIMVSDPAFFAKVFYEAGADSITFHYEALENDEEVLKVIHQIKSYGIKVGISIKPKTPTEVLKPFLDEVDLVLLMSVEPGFGGQSFIEGTYDKLEVLTALRGDRQFLIEIDGGVKGDNASNLIASGADVLVAGSYVFKGDMIANINSINNLK